MRPADPHPAPRSAPMRAARRARIGELKAWLSRIHRDTGGATAMEYILILALVVIPLAALTPMFTRMVKAYSLRMSFMRLPFP